MKKTVIYLFLTLALLSLPLILAPNLQAQTNQTQDIKVLNYSYHVDYESGMLVIVGEVQNTGTTTLQNIVISCTVYSAGDTTEGTGTGHVYTVYMVPQQKMPFEIDITAAPQASGGTWFTTSITKIDFTINQATTTTGYPYPDVKIQTQSSYIDTSTDTRGTYWVTGTVKNTGTQTANGIYVIATFYNSSGTTVAFGYSDPLNQPTKALVAGNTTSFKLGAFDLNMSTINPQQQIARYSLVIRPGDPVLQGTAPDPSAYGMIADSQASYQPGTNTTPNGNGSNNGGNSGGNTAGPSYDWLIYVAIVIIVIIAVIVTIRTLPKRKTQENRHPIHTHNPPPPKKPYKKPQGKTRLLTAPMLNISFAH